MLWSKLNHISKRGHRIWTRASQEPTLQQTECLNTSGLSHLGPSYEVDSSSIQCTWHHCRKLFTLVLATCICCLILFVRWHREVISNQAVRTGSTSDPCWQHRTQCGRVLSHCGMRVYNDGPFCLHNYCCVEFLTHWYRDKMAVVFQRTFSNVFSWMKMYKFRISFDWRVQLTIFRHWFSRQMLGVGHATSHCLNQWSHWGHWWRRLQPTSSIITDAKSFDSNRDDFARLICIFRLGFLYNYSS